jgi:hypothetical protein
MHLLTLVLMLLLVSPSIAEETSMAESSPEVARILKQIKGREQLPAGEVFQNVELLAGVPAERFLWIMENGYSASLGVRCTHCHVEDRWEADEKRAKRATREMILMTREINDKLLSMREIDNSDPVVNCATCHRGYVKPAIQMK